MSNLSAGTKVVALNVQNSTVAKAYAGKVGVVLYRVRATRLTSAGIMVQWPGWTCVHQESSLAVA